MDNIIPSEELELKQYKENTLFETRQTILENSYESGTLQITDALAKQALTAFKSRLEATDELHKARNSRINERYEDYYQSKYIEHSQTQQPQGETYLAIEEWVDDFILTFSDLAEHLKLKDDMQEVDNYMVKKLDVATGDYQKPYSFFKAYTEQMREEYNQGNLPIANEQEQQMAEKLFGNETKKTETYFFKRKEVIKQTIIWALAKSGFEKLKEKYFFQGTVSGTFLYKETFGEVDNFKLVLHEKSKDKGYRTFGKLSQEIVKESCYKFEVPDVRNIWTNRQGDWVIERIETNLYTLLARTYDSNGKPLDNPAYDPKQIEKLVKYVKELDATLKERNSDILGEDNSKGSTNLDDEARDLDNSDIWAIDGDLDLYEAHYIPMLLDVEEKGKKVKKVVNSMMTFVKIAEGKYIPIQVQASPYYRLPYNITPFIPDNSDCFGKSLGDMTHKYQAMIDELLSFTLDIARGSVWGTLLIDEDYIDKAELLSNREPRRIINVKNLRGESIQNKYAHFLPPVEVLANTVNIIDRLSELFRRISRKGISGEKMRPDPSVTEFESISKELAKAVNRTIIRVEQAILEMIKGMYTYTINYREEPIPLNAQANRLTGDADDQLQGLSSGNFQSIEKSFIVDPKELFVDNIGFDLLVVKDKEKETVEKQQAMQLTQMLYQLGTITDPATGQAKVYKDESGIGQVIDEYNLLSGLFIKFGVSPTDIWKKQEQGSPDIQGMLGGADMGGEVSAGQEVNPPQPPTTPPIQGIPQTGNIIGNAQTLR